MLITLSLTALLITSPYALEGSNSYLLSVCITTINITDYGKVKVFRDYDSQ